MILRHSYGMLVIGVVAWVLYIAGVNITIWMFATDPFKTELAGIPFSLVFYYVANARIVFHQPLSIPRFVSVCLMSAVGWLAFLGVSHTAFAIAGLALPVAHVLGAGANAISNLVLQQAVTFRAMHKSSGPSTKVRIIDIEQEGHST